MLAIPIRLATNCVRVVLILAFVAVVLLFFGTAGANAGCYTLGCPSSGGATTRNITVPNKFGIGSRIVGDLYTPYPGSRTQIRERSSTGIGSRIKAYIEPDGTITNTTRQSLGSIGSPYGVKN